MDKIRPIQLAGLSIITGGFAAVLILAISLIVGYPWVYSILGLAGISAISWLLLMNRYLAIFQVNNDVNLKPAKVYDTSTRINVVADDPQGAFSSGRFAELPVDKMTFIRVCRLLNDGGDLSHAGLSGIHRPLSRSQYEALRNKMIKDGLAYWRDPLAHSMGCDLTAAGRAVVKRFANHSQSFANGLSPNGRKSATGCTYSSSRMQAHKATRGNGRGKVASVRPWQKYHKEGQR